jgi:hypothetical protein
MCERTLSRSLSFLVLLSAVVFCMVPVNAADGTVTIENRGSGGAYIGDTVIFNGHNSVGNMTVLRLSGPDLPAGGVPVYDINGEEGTGNPVQVNADGSWRFVWYTSNIHGVSQMQTARYYITAFDFNDPTKTAVASVMMKKPDFSVTPSPNPVVVGKYLQLLGMAEQGTKNVHIEIADGRGEIFHTYDTSASASGYFNYGFHVDMKPGTYYITITSPSVSAPYTTPLSVIALENESSVTTPLPVDTRSGTPPVTNASGSTAATPTKKSSSLPLSPVPVIAGLIGAFVLTGILSADRKRA